MQNILNKKLDAIEKLLDQHEAVEDRGKLFDDLHWRLTQEFSRLGIIAPGVQEQSALVYNIRRYLFLFRVDAAGMVKFWVPSTLVFKLGPNDICKDHIGVTPLYSHWDGCQACYMKYHKNHVYNNIVNGLYNLTGLVRDLPKTQFRHLVLGMQIVYCAQIMQELIWDSVDPKIRALYLHARKIVLEALQEIQQLPEIEVKRYNPLQKLKTSHLFFSFCAEKTATSKPERIEKALIKASSGR